MHVHDEWYMWRDAVSEIWYVFISDLRFRGPFHASVSCLIPLIIGTLLKSQAQSWSSVFPCFGLS